jgi:hypothetical protein
MNSYLHLATQLHHWPSIYVTAFNQLRDDTEQGTAHEQHATQFSDNFHGKSKVPITEVSEEPICEVTSFKVCVLTRRSIKAALRSTKRQY